MPAGRCAKQIRASVNMFYDGLSYKRIAANIAEMFDRAEPSKRKTATGLGGKPTMQ